MSLGIAPEPSTLDFDGRQDGPGREGHNHHRRLHRGRPVGPGPIRVRDDGVVEVDKEGERNTSQQFGSRR